MEGTTISDPKKVLADNLKKLRTSAGISQEELADRAGLHRTYVSSVERAQRNVTLENIFALAKALGTTPAKLMHLPDEEEH
ncbi:MAG: helix-turn-helix transcriptional regulator [Candidatus Dadabacteria bacterium]|nr:helix-turn-helix transcriptional regulator [Candidatus Dadabacteria bacterium]MYA48771.1 helix-turn-helix transcriptional regulator [Candidatus Dadabacteria bacterium]MYG82404.1 helix-turn-helix transcriptional regulator [Candidatus Dadabacteria bacterium]MYK50044.1 helix-turn-helix transcriptional regulator [Candidatus Dadabacteria bacterium]